MTAGSVFDTPDYSAPRYAPLSIIRQAGMEECQRPAAHPGPRFPAAVVYCTISHHHQPSGYAPRHAGADQELHAMVDNLADHDSRTCELCTRTRAILRERAAELDKPAEATVPHLAGELSDALSVVASRGSALAEARAALYAAIEASTRAQNDYTAARSVADEIRCRMHAGIAADMAETRQFWTDDPGAVAALGITDDEPAGVPDARPTLPDVRAMAAELRGQWSTWAVDLTRGEAARVAAAAVAGVLGDVVDFIDGEIA